MVKDIVAKYDDLEFLAAKNPPSLFYRALVRVGYCLGISDRQDCEVLVHLAALRKNKDELLIRSDLNPKVRKHLEDKYKLFFFSALLYLS
jgi:hypothetical protein